MVYFPVCLEILFNVHLLINFLLDNGIAINNAVGVRCVIYSCGELLIVCLIKLVCSCSGGTNCSVSRSRKYMSVVAVEFGESRPFVRSFPSTNDLIIRGRVQCSPLSTRTIFIARFNEAIRYIKRMQMSALFTSNSGGRDDASARLRRTGAKGCVRNWNVPSPIPARFLLKCIMNRSRPLRLWGCAGRFAAPVHIPTADRSAAWGQVREKSVFPADWLILFLLCYCDQLTYAMFFVLFTADTFTLIPGREKMKVQRHRCGFCSCSSDKLHLQ